MEQEIMASIKKLLVVAFLSIFLNGCIALPQAIIWDISDEAYFKRLAQQRKEAEAMLKNYLGKTKEDVYRDFGKPKSIDSAEEYPYVKRMGYDEIWTYAPWGKLVCYEFYFNDGIVAKVDTLP